LRFAHGFGGGGKAAMAHDGIERLHGIQADFHGSGSLSNF
jgi:hypothetical protein